MLPACSMICMPMPCSLAVSYTHLDVYKRQEQYGLERCCFCSYSRLEKIDCIITDTHYEIKHGKDEQEDDNTKVDSFHKYVFYFWLQRNSFRVAEKCHICYRSVTIYLLSTHRKYTAHVSFPFVGVLISSGFVDWHLQNMLYVCLPVGWRAYLPVRVSSLDPVSGRRV